jgi:hypothetical protein
MRIHCLDATNREDEHCDASGEGGNHTCITTTLVLLMSFSLFVALNSIINKG